MFEKNYSSRVCRKKEKLELERTVWQLLWEFGLKVIYRAKEEEVTKKNSVSSNKSNSGNNLVIDQI